MARPGVNRIKALVDCLGLELERAEAEIIKLREKVKSLESGDRAKRAAREQQRLDLREARETRLRAAKAPMTRFNPMVRLPPNKEPK